MFIIEIHICCYDHISIDFPGTLRGRRGRQQWRRGHRRGYRCKHSLKSCWGIWDYVFGIWGCGFGIWECVCSALQCILYTDIYTLKCIDASIRWTEGIGIEVFLHFVKMWSEQFQKFGIGEVALILLFGLFIILLIIIIILLNLSYDHLANVGSGRSSSSLTFKSYG